jgi:translation initiation factor IF-2
LVYHWSNQVVVMSRPALAKINIILKSDVQGSLEAITSSIMNKVNIITSSVGSVTERCSDCCLLALR